jgi:2-dehydro-3-deoxyphosphogluconate aldolase / (4S)-4-hydroxy-2-oxoglutarate aldolase
MASVLSIEEAFPNRVAGVIRTENPEAAFHACLAALEGGVGTVEVTTSVPSCFDIIHGLVASTGGAPVGVGTVWDPAAVREAKHAGARFVVTPVLLPEVAAACREHDLLCVLGALTPTEIYQARVAGAQLVKVFPISAVGGAGYLKSLSGPMPGVPLWVSGGVTLDQVDDYLKLGVRAVGLTTALFDPDALARGDFNAVRERAEKVVKGVGTPSGLG